MTLPAQRAGLRQPSLSEEFRLIGGLLFVVPPDVAFDQLGGHVVPDGAHRVAVIRDVLVFVALAVSPRSTSVPGQSERSSPG